MLKTIKNKILGLSVLPLIGISVLSIFLSYVIIDEITDNVIDVVNKTEIKSQKSNLQDNWEIFASFIELDMTIEEILPTVDNSNYGDNGYFFVLDNKGIVLAHGGDSSAIGKPVSHGGQSDFTIVANCRSKEGCYNTVPFKDPSTGKLTDKLYFSVYIDRLNSVFVTGIIMNDIQQKIDAIDEIMLKVKDEHLQALQLEMLALTLFVAAIAYFMSNKLSSRLTALVKEVDMIAEGNGDLTKEIVIQSNDEIGDLGRAFNKMIASLRIMVVDIKSAAETIEGTTSELDNQTQKIADSMNNQMQETDMVATAINEMSSSAHSVAETALDTANTTEATNGKANQAITIVESASQNISQMIEDFEIANKHIIDLCKEAENIGQVTTVIGDIAAQTNLLALNAAIEAARAGEQGRGFAVVADEVRALAARTASSTKEINDMLNHLNALVNSSVQAMNVSKEQCYKTEKDTMMISQNLIDIVQSMASINELNLSISTASNEQSTVSEEININLSKLQDIASNLTNGCVDTTTKVHELHSESINIVKLVERFTV
ncbi:methyl-accepting chemotaxis protein [Aliivibrio wodanis]|uniref:Methyl-accepting chemotaxis protein n=1 Tax=Aliivibrio wodanis TaxID=80852 RepID=A0A090I8V5_9GAMM|nr:methyl-accepting chemotaxis protein [Aliivibrio wodanis]VVV06763.1 Methyl-accepting chemotaxis protein McpP [Aliivibrio wodanis]